MRIMLDAKDLPDKWYNIVPDLDFPLSPPMSPSGYAVGPHDLDPIAPAPVVEQELETKRREIPIPSEVRDL